MHTTSYTIGIILLLIGSAFFSASETAFTSANTIRLKHRLDNGDRKVAKTLALLDDYDRLLSAVLIGNNIVNITAAALATVLFVELYGGESGVTIATVVLTIATLVFGEISPKTLAKENAERLAVAFTPLMSFMIIILTPLTFIFRQLQHALVRLSGGNTEKTITEEELMTIIDEVEEGGNIEAVEGALIRSALLFDDQQVRDIYTPRVNVVAVSDEDTYEEVSDIFQQTGFSRLPLYHDTIDNILGVIHVKDFYNALIKGQRPSLTELAKPLVFILENRDLARLMSTLQKDKSHMAVITDEYGGTVGIVTLEDIIEELVGEILDEHDEDIPDIEKIALGTYLIQGQSEVDDILPRFGIDVENIEATTIGGWITDILGHIPIEDESIDMGNVIVRVEKATPRYVEQVRLSIKQAAAGGDDGNGIS